MMQIVKPEAGAPGSGFRIIKGNICLMKKLAKK